MSRGSVHRVVVYGLLAASAIFTANGCSTVRTIGAGVREPFSGTALDRYVIDSPDASPLERIAAVADLPFSLVGDTLILGAMLPNGLESLVVTGND